MRQHFPVAAILCVGVASVGTLGCDPVYVNAPVGYTVEKERRIDKPFEAVWLSAVEWFATHNTPIKNLDKGSGLIATEYSLSPDEQGTYADCGAGAADLQGKVELTEPTGNFNLLVKRLGEGSTSVTVNVFWSCVVNTYRYENLLSTNLVLVSSTRKDCASKGVLEKEILDYVTQSTAGAVEPPAVGALPAGSPPSPATAAPPAPAAARGPCTSDTDCRAGRICRDGACTYPVCSKDVDCPPEQICESGTCAAVPRHAVRPCETDKQCPGDQVCERGACAAAAAPSR